MAVLTKEQQAVEMERRKKVLHEYMTTPEYTAAMQQRVELADAGTRSLEARAYIQYLCIREDNPAEGVIFFIENFGWTFNPKMEPKHFPFILFEFQKKEIRRVVDAIINGHDILIEKSREMGVTWIVFVYIPLWFWLFRDGSSFLVGSYKEMLVDDHTDGSIFGKLDYAVQSLPKWILPRKFKFSKHRTKLKLINPDNNNLIGGDTMNPYFGRGMRKTAILFDELGFWDYAKEAWESSGDSTNCRVANSTPHGNNYYAMLGETEIDKITLHWKEHPLKDELWYKSECARRTDEEIAQELDISYSKSREGKVYPEWNEENVIKRKVDYDSSKPLYISWDFGKCVSEDTEALTPEGWKTHNKIDIGDLIYTLNPETGLGEWKALEGKLIKPHKGKINSAYGQGFKSKFLNGHTFPVKRKGVYELDTFDNINSYEWMPSSAKSAFFPESKKYTDSFVEIIAWYWTEGYYNDGGIELSQAKSENFSRIRKVLKIEFGDEFTERKPVLRKNTNLPLIRWYLPKKITEPILDVCTGKEKIVSYDFINRLTKKQLELFVEVSLLADGYNNRLKQASHERLERFAYANLLLGRKISYSFEDMKSYGIYKVVDIFISKPKIVPYNFRRRNKIKEENYIGNVWSPTVDNHIWLARSQGTVYFTGNSDDTAIIWSQPTNEGKLNIIDVYKKSGKNIDYFVPFINGYVVSGKYNYDEEERKIIENHKNWKNGINFGDPSGRFQNQVTDQSVIDVLKDYGIVINYREDWKNFSTKRKSAAKRLINEGIIMEDNPRTKYFNICMINSSYPKIKIEGMDVVRSEKPKHDAYSHYRTSFEYLALGLETMPHRRNKPFDKFKVNRINTGRRRNAIGY